MQMVYWVSCMLLVCKIVIWCMILFYSSLAICSSVSNHNQNSEISSDYQSLTISFSYYCMLFNHLDQAKPIASSQFGTYHLCKQRRFRRACASAQSRQNLCCSLIQAVSQEKPSDRKPDPWPLWMARHAQLKFVMTECSKSQIRLTGLICL